jgi:hypothetical protein
MIAAIIGIHRATKNPNPPSGGAPQGGEELR